MSTFDKQIAYILVEINVAKGLLAELDILWGKFKIHQWLDYLNIPFCCHNCKRTGHMKQNFPSFMDSEDEQDKVLVEILETRLIQESATIHDP